MGNFLTGLGCMAQSPLFWGPAITIALVGIVVALDRL